MYTLLRINHSSGVNNEFSGGQRISEEEKLVFGIGLSMMTEMGEFELSFFFRVLELRSKKYLISEVLFTRPERFFFTF